MTKPAFKTDIASLDAQAMREGFLAKSFSPVDVLAATVARIDRLDPALNAFVCRNERAQRDAEASARRYREGQPLSAIDGVPVAIKDNLAVAGMPATWGSRAFAGSVVAVDELPVARLRAAGAVIVGKTNTPEFAVEGYTGNTLFGVTGNAWNPALTPGGSSGGSVTTVAARMLPIAIGTDGGGSIRRPAAYTGLVGLKPGIGSVPRYGGLPQVLLDFEVVGPVARTVSDIADVFFILSGSDRRDPTSRRALRTDHDRRSKSGPLRILYVEHFGDAPCDPQIAASAQGMAKSLANCGHAVEVGQLPLDIDRLNDLWPTIGAIGLARLVRDVPLVREHASQKYLDMAREGAELGAVHLAEVLNLVQHLRCEASKIFEAIDVIMTPCCAAMPWGASVAYPTEIDGFAVGPRGHAIYTGWVNAIGHPAIAVPADPAADGMPIGVQLVGDLFSEQRLLALAREIEIAQPWYERVPDLVKRDQSFLAHP